MDFKKILRKYGFHFLALIGFFVIAAIYFKPAFEGYVLKQHDIEQYMGMSREIVDYKETDGNTPLWTNSMFSGMPSSQIHVEYSGNIFKKALNFTIVTLKSPVAYLFLYMLGFYIFGLCIRLNRWVNILGAIAFAFSSYNIIILQAGHITKAAAIAFVLPIVGSFIMAYQRSIKWGAIIFGLALSMQLAANHLQITYYSIFIFLGLGIYFLAVAIKKGQIKKFALTSAAILATALIAVMINVGNIKVTKDYSEHTIRGGNDLLLKADGTPIDKSNQEGLDMDYITNWSYGIGESFTFISPYIKGGASESVGNSPFVDVVENADISNEAKDFILRYYSYWGEQPFTSGPVYFGVIVVFLSLLSLVFLHSRIKFVYFGIAVLTLMLSWGKNFMGLTEFMAHNLPMYNKFRAVTIILSITSMIFPILAVLLLNQFYKEREQLKEQKKKFYIVSGSFVFFLLAMKFIGIGDGYFSETDKRQFENILGSREEQKADITRQILAMSEEDLAQNGIDKNNAQQINQIVEAQIERNERAYDVTALKEVRKDIFNYSMNRSLLFVVFAIGILALLFMTELDTRVVYAGLGILIAIDLIGVDLNYLNNKENERGDLLFWHDKSNYYYPELATSADIHILNTELQQTPALKDVIQKGEQKGKENAEKLGMDNSNRSVDYEVFRALNRNTNYRVLDLTANPFNSSRASYFHKSIGGYHGAKLRNYQNLIEHHFAGAFNFKVLEMLNAKYIIQQDGNVMENPTALGNAWLIREVKTFATPDEEIRALGNLYTLTPKTVGKLLVNGQETMGTTVSGTEKIQFVLQTDTFNVAISSELQRNLRAGMSSEMEAVFVMDRNKKTDFILKTMLESDTTKSFLQLIDLKVAYSFEPSTDVVMLESEAKKLSAKSYSGMGTIQMTSYHPEKIAYSFESDAKQLAVFSEIYYKGDWKAFIDGKEVPIIKSNYLLRGVEIPAGKHHVELKYVYPFFKTANLLAITGCGIFGLLVIFGFWSDRKKGK